MNSHETKESASLQSDVKREVTFCDEPMDCDDSAASNGLQSRDNSHSDFDAFCRFAFPENENSEEANKSNPFYFESDHVALKGNEDYRRLIGAFVLLESQRTATLHDLDVLLELQQKALHDPLEFVNQLQSGRLKTQFPRPCKIAELPKVAWERYTDDVEAVLASLGGAAHSTRQKQKRELMSGIRDSATIVCPNGINNTTTTTTTTTTMAMNRCMTEPSKQRPSTFNQPWSADEQRLLERLLQKYPPERFEARRFAKIAGELPGRTTQQVTSRVQKYFIKLAKARLPVPGRMPNLSAYGGRWFSGRFHGHHQRYNHLYFPSSTFLTSYAPPVYMSDDDDNDDDDVQETSAAGVCRQSVSAVNETTADDEGNDIPECLRDTDEYRELKTLTALRRSLLSTQPPVSDEPIHKRAVLTSSVSNFLSQNCTTDGRRDKSLIDLDYTSESTGVSSYLDPNYMPAV